MKKNRFVIMIVFFTMIFYSAVFASEHENENDVENAPPSPPASQGEPGAANYGFTSFDLEIDMPKQRDAIEASYEVESDGTIEAKYSNQLTGVKLMGDEAIELLDELFRGMSLTPEITKDDVISTVSQAFGAPDYKKIEVEIFFKEAGKKKFKARQ